MPTLPEVLRIATNTELEAIAQRKAASDAQKTASDIGRITHRVNRLAGLLGLNTLPTIIARPEPADISLYDRAAESTFTLADVDEGLTVAWPHHHATEHANVHIVTACEDCGALMATPVANVPGAAMPDVEQWVRANMRRSHLPVVGCGEPF